MKYQVSTMNAYNSLKLLIHLLIILIFTIKMSHGASLNLAWDANTEGDLAGYNVYRSEVSGGPYDKINSDVIAVLNYDDYTAAPGITYSYCVVAQIIAASESRLSEEVQAMLGIEEYGVNPLSSIMLNPNPFRIKLGIRLANRVDFCARFYDSKGAVAGELKGCETAVWSPGNSLPAGVYFIEITTETAAGMHKVVKIE